MFEELLFCVCVCGWMCVCVGGVYVGVFEIREKDGERAGGRAMVRRGSGGCDGGGVGKGCGVGRW